MSEHWTTRELRTRLREREVDLLTPGEHRDRWLSGVASGACRFKLAQLADEPLVEHIDAVLDAAAGVLLELPRLEADAWAGWKDKRLDPVFRILAMAELPQVPPRSMLIECWDELRQRVPFSLDRPRSGDSPRAFQAFRDPVLSYLVRVREEAGRVSDREVGDRGRGDRCPPVAPRLLALRLEREVAMHEDRVRRRVLPLAHHLWASAFPAQRAALTLQRSRGENESVDEGRGLRKRVKHRFHLAAWVLRVVGLSRLEVGLFLHQVDAKGLGVGELVEEPLDDGTVWTQKLEKAVDNSLVYWRTGPGSRGLPPEVEMISLEGGMRTLLSPATSHVP